MLGPRDAPIHVLAHLCIASAVIAIAACTGVVRAGSQRATEGALGAAAAKIRQIDKQQIARTSAGAAVEGALASLDDPAVRRRLEELMAASAVATLGVAHRDPDALRLFASLATIGAATGLADELDGETGLRRAMADTTRELSASAVAGVRDELSLFPDCEGGDRQRCIEERIVDLSRAVSRAATEGVMGTIGIGLLVLAFATGAVLALFVTRIRTRTVSP